MALYLVKSFTGASIFPKLAFIFLLVAMILGWIAFTTANWCRTYPTSDDAYYFGYGVWRNADNLEPFGTDVVVETVAFTGKVEHNDGWLLPWYGAFQAFAVFGFISLNIAFLLVVVFMFVDTCKSNRDLAFWNAINCFFSFLCWLIAVILFGARYKDFDKNHRFDEPNVSYSFIFAIFTCALMLATGIVLILSNHGGGAVRQQQQQHHEQQQRQQHQQHQQQHREKN